MIITLDGLELPKYNAFREVTTPNVAENITLDGSLYVDYRFRRRAWVITWDMLEASVYDLIKAKYDKQFSNDTLLRLVIAEYGIDLDVYMKINEKEIKYNGSWVQGLTITLEEADAVS